MYTAGETLKSTRTLTITPTGLRAELPERLLAHGSSASLYIIHATLSHFESRSREAQKTDWVREHAWLAGRAFTQRAVL